MERDFAAWYKRTSPPMMRQLSMSLNDEALAFEATADAYARAYERWSRVQKMENPEGWIFRTAMNSVKRVWRRRALERRAIQRATNGERRTTPESTPPVVDELTLAVNDLPPQMQRIVKLKYWGGLPDKEIASELGVAPGTVAATLYAARHKLGTHLEKFETLGEEYSRERT